MPFVGNVVTHSFAEGQHSMRNPTRKEITERVDLCRKIVDTMRQELKWSKHRIRDTLDLAVRARLSGLHLDLSLLGRRGTW
jgi:hypothetical protein